MLQKLEGQILKTLPGQVTATNNRSYNLKDVPGPSVFSDVVLRCYSDISQGKKPKYAVKDISIVVLLAEKRVSS